MSTVVPKETAITKTNIFIINIVKWLCLFVLIPWEALIFKLKNKNI